ncbi:MAG: DUF898 family protein [Proteobacteria bacterium]|nr:DUF898 family protein [Pseudomonadota bacterium]
MAENSVVQPQRLARWDGTTVAPGDVMAFDGRRGPLARLVLKNMILTVLTLGIYRFWAKTAVRHWFWRHISIAEERLEYSGKGSELFVGFLIALCVLLPFFAVTSILEQVASTSAVGAVVSQTVYFAGLFLLIQTAIFRMRRYRLTRTMWRGIRCGLDGRTWGYVKAAVGYWLLVIVTLGFAYPWMRTGLSRHLMTRTRFGAQNFGFEANPRELVVHWIPIAIVWLVILGCAVFSWSSVEYYPGGQQRPVNGAAAYSGLAILLLLLAQLPLYVRYRTREFCVFASKTSLGEVRFESNLRANQIIWLFVWTAMSLLVFFALVISLFGALIVQAAGSSPGGLGAGVVGTLIVTVIFAAIVLPAVNLVFVQFGLTKAVVNSLAVINLPAVEGIIQSTQEIPGHGEGLADAFDLGDF